MEEVTNYLDSGFSVDVSKIQARRNGGNVLRWIENLLSFRQQKVALNGQYPD